MSENTLEVSGKETEDEISLLDLAIVMAKHKKIILGVPFIVAVIAAAISLLITPVYTATTKILSPQQNQSAASAMLSQLGALGAGAAAAGLKNPNDLYIGILQSRTIADGIIKRFNLDEYYGSKFPSDTRNSLAAATAVKAGKDGIITIEFSDRDPKRAADIANAYVGELFDLSKNLAVTEAAQRRLFFEKQVEQARDNLIKAEVAAREAMAEGGLIKVDDQGRAVVESTARLRAQVAVKKVEIGAMRSYAADRNPQLLAAQQELLAIKTELAKLEGIGDQEQGENVSSTRGMKNLGLLREVKYYETVFELMAKQFEMAKIDEAKDPSLIQVIDKAIVPDRKSAPKRTVIVLISALVAGFATVLWAFAKEGFEKARRNPESAERLATFRSYMSGRRQA